MLKKRLGFILLLVGLLTVLLSTAVKAQELLLVDVEIPEGYQQLKQGDPILAETQIILVGNNRTDTIIDVLIEYMIKDKEGNLITKVSETKGGVVRIQTVKELQLPADLPMGVYSITTKASYKDIAGETSASFKITRNLGQEQFSSSFFNTRNLLILLLLGIITLIFLSAYQFWRIGRLYHK